MPSRSWTQRIASISRRVSLADSPSACTTATTLIGPAPAGSRSTVPARFAILTRPSAGIVCSTVLVAGAARAGVARASASERRRSRRTDGARVGDDQSSGVVTGGGPPWNYGGRRCRFQARGCRGGPAHERRTGCAAHPTRWPPRGAGDARPPRAPPFPRRAYAAQRRMRIAPLVPPKPNELVSPTSSVDLARRGRHEVQVRLGIGVVEVDRRRQRPARAARAPGCRPRARPPRRACGRSIDLVDDTASL